MDNSLPSYFDVIVIGTGITESIVSAAAARVGHSVLHIDPRDYYGGKWATLNWNDWAAGVFANPPSTLTVNEFNSFGTYHKSGEGQEESLVWRNDVRDLESLWYTRGEEDGVKAEVKGLQRRFNIDINPKVLMAREEIVQLLIQSNVSRYLEFSCINSLMTNLPPPLESTIESIPLSRSDIFTTKAISLVEKRKLMKFLEFVLGSSNNDDAPAKSASTFNELASTHKLTPKVTHLIQAAVRTMDDAMEMTGDNFNLNFTENCRLFLQSINRYGNKTPFLWTLYGVSEICQSFCRLSAIYGGTYILKRPIEAISEEKPDLLVIVSEGMEIQSKFLVLCPEIKFMHTGSERSKSPKCIQGITLVRGVLLVNGPRLKEEPPQDQPIEGGPDAKKLTIYRFGDMDVVELEESSLVVPKNFRLLQVSLPYHEGTPSPREIIESRLSPYVNFNNQSETFCPDSRPRALHGSYFFLDFYDDIRDEDLESPRIFHCNSSSTELKDHVEKAREIFSRMFPNDEFLPKAPEPQEHEQDDVEMVDHQDQPIEEEIENHHQNGIAAAPENE